MKKLIRSIFTLPYIPKIPFTSKAADEKDAYNESTFLDKSQHSEAMQIVQQYHQSVRNMSNEDLGLDKEIFRPMEEFSAMDYYLTGNLPNFRYHRLSPIPEESKEELARWNESTEFDENPTQTEKQREKNDEKKIPRGRNSLSKEQSISSPTKNAPEMVKILQEMTTFTVIKESKQKKNSKGT